MGSDIKLFPVADRTHPGWGMHDISVTAGHIFQQLRHPTVFQLEYVWTILSRGSSNALHVNNARSSLTIATDAANPANAMINTPMNSFAMTNGSLLPNAQNPLSHNIQLLYSMSGSSFPRNSMHGSMHGSMHNSFANACIVNPSVNTIPNKSKHPSLSTPITANLPNYSPTLIAHGDGNLGASSSLSCRAVLDEPFPAASTNTPRKSKRRICPTLVSPLVKTQPLGAPLLPPFHIHDPTTFVSNKNKAHRHCFTSTSSHELAIQSNMESANRLTQEKDVHSPSQAHETDSIGMPGVTQVSPDAFKDDSFNTMIDKVLNTSGEFTMLSGVAHEKSRGSLSPPLAIASPIQFSSPQLSFISPTFFGEFQSSPGGIELDINPSVNRSIVTDAQATHNQYIQGVDVQNDSIGSLSLD